MAEKQIAMAIAIDPVRCPKVSYEERPTQLYRGIRSSPYDEDLFRWAEVFGRKRGEFGPRRVQQTVFDLLDAWHKLCEARDDALSVGPPSEDENIFHRMLFTICLMASDECTS
jgi:hypothetical protein